MPSVAGKVTLAKALATWPAWNLGLTQAPSVRHRVVGGLTNRSFRLDAPGRDQHLLLRLNHPDPLRLGIDRALEHQIVDEVARRGIGRPMLYRDPEDRFSVFPWIEARAWTAADLADSRQRERLRPLLEALAEVDLSLPSRRYAVYLRRYWAQIEHQGPVDARLAEAWLAFEPRLVAFDESDWAPGLTHHDLVPANILDTGRRLVLIDWEYAAVGHPAIDRWSIDPESVPDPFIGELMGWVNGLWTQLRG